MGVYYSVNKYLLCIHCVPGPILDITSLKNHKHAYPYRPSLRKADGTALLSWPRDTSSVIHKEKRSHSPTSSKFVCICFSVAETKTNLQPQPVNKLISNTWNPPSKYEILLAMFVGFSFSYHLNHFHQIAFIPTTSIFCTKSSSFVLFSARRKGNVEGHTIWDKDSLTLRPQRKA